jgi:hypothetical protein
LILIDFEIYQVPNLLLKFGIFKPINTYSNNNNIIKIKFVFLSTRDKKRKKKIKISILFWGLNSRPSVSMHLTVILAYLNTLQSGSSVLEGSYL